MQLAKPRQFSHQIAAERASLQLVPAPSPEQRALWATTTAVDAASKAVAAFVEATGAARRELVTEAAYALENARAQARKGSSNELEASLTSAERSFREAHMADLRQISVDIEARKAREAASAAPLAPPAAVVTERARRWVAHRPELASRMAKAIALVGGVSLIEANTYRVEGGAADYTVRVDRAARYSECTCPDSAARGSKCKHRLAVALVLG